MEEVQEQLFLTAPSHHTPTSTRSVLFMTMKRGPFVLGGSQSCETNPE